ncbi:hypothetical protein [Corynebacterium glyciniphilum]|uniref:hypothetical protein n=1 Tax=Corynebacterium glyciniphilum TaxID=1404244 RepID=UPI0011AB5210|nr:hypothetical protein [Corynebacterium glyciniphilum]
MVRSGRREHSAREHRRCPGLRGRFRSGGRIPARVGSPASEQPASPLSEADARVLSRGAQPQGPDGE